MASRIVLNTISYHGHGAIENIVPELTARGYKKAFVCSDPDPIKFGVTKKVTDLLDAAGFAYSVYSEIKPNPTIQNVQDGVAAFKAAETDCIVTIGGGSSMDTAKAIGIIINNPEFADVRSLEGVAPTKKHAVFTIAVPTTAGTAAEVTINYVITDVEKKRKFVCVDTNDIPEIAVVDPDMMSSMPKGLTAATGMDALTHAIEGYITKGHCTISDMFHLEAIKLISENLRGAVQNTPEGREGMALGQYIAGMGFSNVGLGIVHSMAHGLSALYDTPHGVACAIILPTGLEYNKTVAGERYRAVGKAMGVTGIDEMNDVEAADATIAAVKKLSADVGIPADLKGILKEEDIQFLAESAFADACCPGNPRDTSVEEIEDLYRISLSGLSDQEQSILPDRYKPIQDIADQFQMPAYTFLLLQFPYYWRCNYFHGNKPTTIISAFNDRSIAVLRTINYFLDSFLCDEIPKLLRDDFFDDNFYTNVKRAVNNRTNNGINRYIATL